MSDYKVNVFYSDDDVSINDIFTKVIVHEVCKKFKNIVSYSYAYLFHDEGGNSGI